MVKFARPLVLGAIVAFVAGSAQASVVVPTGGGWTLTNYSGSDPNAQSLIGTAASPAAYDAATFPFSNWAPPIAGSEYITPAANAAENFDPSGADGFYTFTSSSIYLTAGTVIAGKYLADNTVTEIFLTSSSGVASLLTPGLTPGHPAGGYATPTYFAFTGVSDPGLYQLNFIVQNYNHDSGSPVGLDVGAVPEPATWAMMLIGFLGLAFLGYRKSSKPRNAALSMA